MDSTPDERYAAWERAAEWPLTGFAMMYLVAYAVPILDPALGTAGRRATSLVMTLTWAAFAADYFVKLALARQRWRFIRTHLVDMLIVALPMLRPLRVLRILTAFSLLNRRATTWLRGRVIIYVAGAVALLGFVASLAVLDAERHNPQANITSFGDALWWALSTITTTGYGDRYPTTTEGRLIAASLMLAGIALLGVVTATVASWFVQRVNQIESEESDIRRELVAVRDELRALRQVLAAEGTVSDGRPPEPRRQRPVSWQGPG